MPTRTTQGTPATRFAVARPCPNVPQASSSHAKRFAATAGQPVCTEIVESNASPDAHSENVHAPVVGGVKRKNTSSPPAAPHPPSVVVAPATVPCTAKGWSPVVEISSAPTQASLGGGAGVGHGFVGAHTAPSRYVDPTPVHSLCTPTVHEPSGRQHAPSRVTRSVIGPPTPSPTLVALAIPTRMMTLCPALSGGLAAICASCPPEHPSPAQSAPGVPVSRRVLCAVGQLECSDTTVSCCADSHVLKRYAPSASGVKRKYTSRPFASPHPAPVRMPSTAAPSSVAVATPPDDGTGMACPHVSPVGDAGCGQLFGLHPPPAMKVAPGGHDACTLIEHTPAVAQHAPRMPVVSVNAAPVVALNAPPTRITYARPASRVIALICPCPPHDGDAVSLHATLGNPARFAPVAGQSSCTLSTLSQFVPDPHSDRR